MLPSLYFGLDIDECDLAMPCDSNALCTNTNGSFECACNSGYSGNGFACLGTLYIFYYTP